MRKIIFESAVSVDGFIEGPNGEMDWLVLNRERFDAVAFLSRFDTIFCGRKAYERLEARAADEFLPDAQREFHRVISQMRKYVFSRKEKHLPGNGMVVSENLEGEVQRIRDELGKDIWFCGGADILSTFAELDLVDEYVLVVHPVMLKSGKSLFAGTRRPLNLKLLEQRNLESGVISFRYLPESRIGNLKNRIRYGGSV
ncbi:MAG TPA: dihydrofolate reductase family protein [Chryseosolibacter sp.]